MLGQFGFDLLSQQGKIASMLTDSRQLTLLGRSCFIAFSAAFTALVIGLPVAVLLSARDLPFRKLFYFLALMPLLIPPYILAGAWIHFLSPSGVVNQILTAIWGPSAKLSIFSEAGCIWCLGISFFPIITVIVSAGLSQIDRSLDDIARLSSGRWSTFRHSTLLQISPHLIASICLVMIFVFAQYGVPSLLGVNTYPVEIFAQFSAFYNENAAVATSLPIMILVIILVLVQRKIMRRHNYIRINPSSESDNSIKLGTLKYSAVIFLTLIFVVIIILPFASVLAYIKDFSKIVTAFILFKNSFFNTTLLAFLAAVICTFIGFVIGDYLAHNRSHTAEIFDMICWFPIAIPGTIISLGLIKFAGLIPALRRMDSFGILLLCAYIGIFSAFSIRIFVSSIRRADTNVSEAAAMDCTRWYQRLIYVEIPLHLKAIMASVVIVFVLVIGELNATVLLVPPGKETLAVAIDNFLHYGANVYASALCLIEALFVVLIATAGIGFPYLFKRLKS
ncbi:MAG: iron ABC transporter permease [Phycisphaerae bacterium]|nr:iron ABC transporter permease [Phycisphaerae bacterium]